MKANIFMYGVLALFVSAPLFGGPADASGEIAGGFEHVMNIGTKGSGPGQFRYVEDFAFAKNGNLLVTDAATGFVQVFDATTGEYISRWAAH